MTDTHKYQLQLSAEADSLVAVDVSEVPAEAVPEWIAAVRQMMQKAGYQMPAILLGSVRIVPEDTGCRVGYDQAPIANMQWFDSLTGGLARAVEMHASPSGNVRARIRDEAETRGRRVLSRMINAGIATALTEELADSHAELQDEIRRLRLMLETAKVAGVNLKAHREPDGNISVSVVDADGSKSSIELAREAAQFLGPLMMTYADMHSTLQDEQPSRRPAAVYEDSPEEEEDVSIAETNFLDGYFSERARNEIVEGLDAGQRLFRFADVEVKVEGPEQTGTTTFQLSVDQINGRHSPPMAAAKIGEDVRVRCADLELLGPLTDLVLALTEGAQEAEEPETGGSPHDLAGPAFPDDFNRQLETSPPPPPHEEDALEDDSPF